ncbi:methylated-DNA--[protein]-cysteine S-methyltransferase [Aureispira anguillae]|uniref:Methylated-DNA--[protein]-cysteine S-methyltransferase n=1 Tax=Aureispira anguillae TaxID=2864201 RepID=A0A916DQB6_9BACT|nr:methylated-DNA--[protein]-cysteine S-methyltransferase [Aureispira anguillae]BDS10000.1 methylated-DNA--[protein]-cysteine S-methyltransferase [Aureispira anguillae]
METTINYQRIEKALHFIANNVPAQPKVGDIAAHLNMSKHHFQRIFKAWAGISPKQFLQFLTLQNLKKEIEASKNLLELTEKVGLSTPSRTYDLFVKIEALSPGEYQQKGNGITIQYGSHSSPFGTCFLAQTKRGICALDFITNSEEAALKNLKSRFPKATFIEDNNATGAKVEQIFSPSSTASSPIPLLLSGTPFQLKVWEALINIPFANLQSYQQIAQFIGKPKASRAVGSAIGQNHIAYLIPCHRVIRSIGAISDYKWNKARKVAMIGWEKAQIED